MHPHKHLTPDIITQKPSKREGETRVGMTPTILHYCSNKVSLFKVYKVLTMKQDLPYERLQETVKSHPVKGF